MLFSFLFILLVMYMFMCSNFFWNREKLSCYECGFDFKDCSRLPFSLRFFTILLVFLLFDIEMVFLLQFPLEVLSSKYMLESYYVYLGFIIIIFFSTLLEWFKGLLSWL